MRRTWGWLSVLTLALLVGVTGVSTWAVRGTVRGQENRLLRERANEVGLVLRQAVSSLSSQLQTVGGVMRATEESPAAFQRASATLVATSKGRDSIALLRHIGTGYHVALADGTALQQGESITGPLADTLSLASSLTGSGVVDAMVPTQVMGAGPDRTIGFAYGPPVAPDGTVLYLQLALGTLGPPHAADTDPFNELHVVLYDAPTPVPAQALVATTAAIPLTGDVRTVMVHAGAATWALQVSAAHPLVGTTTANAAWITLAGGLVLAVLLALVVEIETRRRRSALALYRTEHRLAEALQRSLLPDIPTVDRLELAAFYLPGAAEQEVGGDWYDTFALEDGRVGLAIGDVLGHDIDAATLMSRVQTALRAYALLGEQPGAVLDRLETLLGSLNTERLVTVFYGVLGPVAPDGSRDLVYANAGHPTPLVSHSSGRVDELDGAGSLLLGVAAGGEPRPQESLRLLAGSTLLLYTDGLVEVPGKSLTDQLDDLKREIATRTTELSMSELCDWLLRRVEPEDLRDDVAVLIVGLPDLTVANDVQKPDTGRRDRWGFLRLGASMPKG